MFVRFFSPCKGGVRPVQPCSGLRTQPEPRHIAPVVNFGDGMSRLVGTFRSEVLSGFSHPHFDSTQLRSKHG